MTVEGRTLVEVLRERGFIANLSNEEGLTQALAQKSCAAYCGFDVTATSLHVGNLVSIMLLTHVQRGGHRAIAVVGGGTTMIGDPSGKTLARPLLPAEVVQQNLPLIRRQFERYLSFSDGRASLLNNADWLLDLRYVSFLREIGQYFTVNQLLQHETYRDRLERESLSFLELNYALVQAYDFLHLFQEHGCVVQVGGNDQWFNILAGVELIRRAAGGEAFALTTPLLTTASGQKMGKTETGAVWLDPSLTSPYDYYQFWRNVEDPDVGRFLRLFTFLPLDEIRELEALPGRELNTAKERLAFEATRITHGRDQAVKAEAAARARFVGEGEDQGPALAIDSAQQLLDILVRAGVAESRNAAKRLIRGGGVRLGGCVEAADRCVSRDELPVLLIVGKRRIRLEPG